VITFVIVRNLQYGKPTDKQNIQVLDINNSKRIFFQVTYQSEIILKIKSLHWTEQLSAQDVNYPFTYCVLKIIAVIFTSANYRNYSFHIGPNNLFSELWLAVLNMSDILIQIPHCFIIFISFLNVKKNITNRVVGLEPATALTLQK